MENLWRSKQCVAYGVIDEVVSSRTFSILAPSASAPIAHHEVVLMYKTSSKVKINRSNINTLQRIRMRKITARDGETSVSGVAAAQYIIA